MLVVKHSKAVGMRVSGQRLAEDVKGICKRGILQHITSFVRWMVAEFKDVNDPFLEELTGTNVYCRSDTRSNCLFVGREGVASYIDNIDNSFKSLFRVNNGEGSDTPLLQEI